MIQVPPALVVVPCLNEAPHLPALLSALCADPASQRIIVADGGSTDGSRDIVRKASESDPRICLLDNPKRIQSAGVNLAVAQFGSGHQWLVRVDSHCRYPANYISTLLEAAERNGADSVVVPMVTESLDGCFQRGVAAAQNSVLGTGGSAHRHIGAGQWVDHGHHALMRLAAFTQVGGYDEGFRANEDAELDLRIATSGGLIWLEPAAAITYFPRRTPISLALQYFRYGSGRAMTVRRHRTRMRLRQLLPLAILPALLLGLLGAISLPESLVLAAPAGSWLALSIGYGLWLGYRARSLCVASSGIAAIIMHAAWSTGFWSHWLSRRPTPRPPEIHRPAQ